ncbi:4-alpha-glucan branching enzyme GlgB [Heracleum sosnowskyi]|uniref:4-alpha-glucan branching enzyme GlgB n=1 Tax=Heracleum sosnowskyi TaxID=360622 RepID=A0AAD8HZ13_9APIA|nr:4-alpha-glucan branching enzyme GlgB [Heracleum sosnowskyi]
MASLKPSSLLFTLTLLLITTPQPSHSFPFSSPYQSLFSFFFSSLSFSSYKTLFSLAHSLTSRVANLRASRGDLAGAARARSLAQKIRPGIGLGFWRFMMSLGWDYMRNYSWRDVGSVSDALGFVSDLNELMRVVNELTRFESNSDRAVWVQRNYKNVLKVTKSMFRRLTKVFYQQGPLRELVQMLQKEVVEGELLRDCLELGSDDLKGLIQIIKDVALQYSSTPRNNEL